MQWLLKHDNNLEPMLSRPNYNQQVHGPWILEDINYDFYCDDLPDNSKEALVREKFEWNSDNENVIDTEDRVEEHYSGYISILGFHPYKEIVFLCESFESESLKRGLAYHLNCSKLEDLGNLYPKCYDDFAHPNEYVEKSFPYTPCWIDEFPDNN